MRLTIAYSKIKKRNLVLIDNATYQKETLSERPIRQPLSSILLYLCTNITQINFRQFFQRILLNMFKHTITQQEMPKIIVSI